MKPKALIIFLFLAFIISCEKDLGDKLWTYYYETQCANPWPVDPLIRTESKVQDYLETNNIQVFEVKIKTYYSGIACTACNCTSGRKIYVLILKSDLENILKLGFKEY